MQGRSGLVRLSGVIDHQTPDLVVLQNFENYGKLSGVIRAIFQILVVSNTNNTIGSYAPAFISAHTFR